MKMEIEPSGQEKVVPKKLWNNILQTLIFPIRKGVSNTRIKILDLHLLLKRRNFFGKVISHLMIHHNHFSPSVSALSCRSNEALSFVSPREYEFSCNNSPAFYYPSYNANNTKRRKYPPYHFAKDQYRFYDDVSTVGASPTPLLPGFGASPLVRQLRITDSPFPLKDEGDSKVDKAAEEFIKNFYEELKLQK